MDDNETSGKEIDELATFSAPDARWCFVLNSLLIHLPNNALLFLRNSQTRGSLLSTDFGQGSKVGFAGFRRASCIKNSFAAAKTNTIIIS